jgi:hypothetical protein
MEGERRLHDADLAEGSATRHDVGAFERQDGGCAHSDPRRPLCRRAMRRDCGRAHHPGEAGPTQSDSAPAARSAARLARRKSRFIVVMVSMLICLGQAS